MLKRGLKRTVRLYIHAMARPREFDPDQALEDAMSIFWSLGYQATTLPDLLKGMNLSRGSFYKAYKDKKSLFLSALSKYDEEVVSQAAAFIEQGDGTPMGRILTVFESVVQLVAENDRRGCLLCTTLAESDINDADIARIATASFSRMRLAFQSALEREFPMETAVTLSHFLTTQYLGMRILTRTHAPLSEFKHNAQAVEQILKAAQTRLQDTHAPSESRGIWEGRSDRA